MSWLRTRRDPSTGASYNTGTSSQRSRPVPWPVVLDVLALLSCCCTTEPMMFCTQQAQRGSRSLRVTVPQIQVDLSGFCPGHDVLEIVRPVISHTLALCSKRSRPVASPASCQWVASQAPTAGWLFVSRKLRSPSFTSLR